MKLTRTCRDVTRLVLEGEDRGLTLGERVAIRLHLVICAACPRFLRQVELMRSASQRWRAYSEQGDDRDRP
jgi:hypothetical protein